MTKPIALKISLAVGLIVFFLASGHSYFAFGENPSLPNAGGNADAPNTVRVTSTVPTSVSTAQATSTELNAEFALAVGHTLAVPSDEMKIKFEAVESDPRCTTNNSCGSTAGRGALVRFIAKSGEEGYARLSAFQTKQVWGDYTITMSKLDTTNNYTAMLTISKAGATSTATSSASKATPKQ